MRGKVTTAAAAIAVAALAAALALPLPAVRLIDALACVKFYLAQGCLP